MALSVALVILVPDVSIATTESFEKVVGAGNNVFFIPSGYVFPSGLKFIGTGGDTPAVEDNNPGPTGCYGRSPISPVPDGTAFVCGSAQIQAHALQFEFPDDVSTFNLVVAATTTSGDQTFHLLAFDSADNLVSSASLANAGFSTWNSNKMTIDAASVRRFALYGNNGGGLVLDLVSFTFGDASPSPSERREEPAAAVSGIPPLPAGPVRGDDYPLRNASLDEVDPWAFYSRECTSFVAWRLNQFAGTTGAPWAFYNTAGGPLGHGDTEPRRWSNASHWDDHALEVGYRVDAVPAVGAIAHWDAGESSWPDFRTVTVGHVAYVAEILPDNFVVVEEYNATNDHTYRTRVMTKAPRYIHIFD